MEREGGLGVGDSKITDRKMLTWRRHAEISRKPLCANEKRT